jgi:hypothetical protein
MSVVTHPPLPPAPTISGSRAVLLGIAALLCAAAALAIGILLLGDFGGTEGRILATTFLLAGYGVLALPAAHLRDRGRLPALAAACAALAATGAALSIALVWSGGEGELLGKTTGTVLVWLLATSQTAALVTWAYRRLFAGSIVVAAVAASLFTLMLWAEIDSSGYGRVLGAVVVLDVLLVALQPLLVRARRAQQPWTFTVADLTAGTSEVTVAAASLAEAAARAIRTVEERGGHVRSLELVDAGDRRAGT